MTLDETPGANPNALFVVLPYHPTQSSECNIESKAKFGNKIRTVSVSTPKPLLIQQHLWAGLTRPADKTLIGVWITEPTRSRFP